MLNLSMTRQLKHVDLAHQVRTDIGLRVDQGIADARLRPQVNDPTEPVRLGKGLQRGLIAEIDLIEGEGVAMGRA